MSTKLLRGAENPVHGTLLVLAVTLTLILLTACSSISARRQERLAAYNALPSSAKALVSQGKVEPGMDTNAVWIAWGPPSQVVQTPSTPPQTIWFYYGNTPVLVPDWTFIPTARGYWSLEYTPRHYSKLYLRGQVVFQNGRVVTSKHF